MDSGCLRNGMSGSVKDGNSVRKAVPFPENTGSPAVGMSDEIRIPIVSRPGNSCKGAEMICSLLVSKEGDLPGNVNFDPFFRIGRVPEARGETWR